MGLLNLKTDLKSLKYGSDRPNSGDSREPFIKKEIPEDPAGASPDFLLRQGALKGGIEDGIRIGKFLTTTKGVGFTTNMNLLAAQNPKIPGDPKNFYNPLNTLVQVAANAVGGHTQLLGLDPEEGEKYITLYKNQYSEASSNKLNLLKYYKIGPDVGQNSIRTNPISVNNLGINPNFDNLLQTYIGGSGAGITGLKTNIRRTEFTVGSEGYTGKTTEKVKDKSQERIAESKTYFNQDSLSGSLSEVTYGAGADNKVVTLKNAFSRGSNATLKQTTADPGYTTSSYIAGSDVTDDRFNKLSTQAFNTEYREPVDQLFKFFLNPITPDSPEASEYLYWQAYVESFSDNINAEHDAYTYVGRGYPSYKYKGFTREISMDFTIVSHHPSQTEIIYRKLNRLMSLLAPNYSGAGYLRGNFFKLTFGDYLTSTPGILKGFNLTPIFDAGFDLGRGDETSGFQLPKAIKVSGFNFTPIADNKNAVYNTDASFINKYNSQML